MQLSGPPSLPLAGGTLKGPLTLSNGVNANNLPLVKGYVSSDSAVVLGARTTFAHGLGADPVNITIDLVCVIAELGFAVGAVVRYAFYGNNSNGGIPEGIACRHDATNIVVTLTNQHLTMVGEPSGAGNFITPANWNFRVRAQA